MSRPHRRPFSPWGMPLVSWMELAQRSTATWVASAEVIAQRSQQMASMGATPSAADRRELQRMVDEKVSAVGESAQAMGRQAVALMLASTTQWMNMAHAQTLAMLGSGRAPSAKAGMAAAMRASVAMADAGLKPFHRRATANASRLRKRR